MRPLLERVPLFRSRDLEAARAFYAVKGTGFEAIRSGKENATPHVRVNGLYLQNLWFGYVQFDGAGVALRLTPHSTSFRAVDNGQGRRHRRLLPARPAARPKWRPKSPVRWSTAVRYAVSPSRRASIRSCARSPAPRG